MFIKMKALFWKDKRRRFLYFILEKKKRILKNIFWDKTLPQKIRIKAFFKLKTLTKNSNICRIKNRCLLTNRSKSIYKRFYCSRLVFRRLALNGELVGIKKASW